MKKLKLIIYPAKRINASVTTAYVTNTVSRLHVQYVTEFCCCWRALLLDHLLSDSVHNMKNVKALWEWLKYWLYVWDKFGFEKSHGNRNFGFDLLASVRVFNWNRTEIRFPHIPRYDSSTKLLLPIFTPPYYPTIQCRPHNIFIF